MQVALRWSRDGQLTNVYRYDGANASVSAGTSIYTFDANGWETGIQNFDGNVDLRSSITMGYDSLGRIKAQSEWADVSTDPALVASLGQSTYTSLQPFTYDPVGNLTAAGNTSYQDDPEGNPTNNGAVIGPGNRLQEDANYTYSYDGEGNLVRKVAKTGSIQWDYSYDEANRLIRVTETDTSQNQVILQVDYSYDALGNRVERVQTSGGVQSIQRYAYDGQNVWGDFDGSDVLQTRYLRGAAVDQLFGRVDTAGSQIYWDWTDRLGSIRTWTDATGTPVAFLNYDAFGNPDPKFFVARSFDVGRYGFTGREYDSSTGLQYNRARYYDPSTGRWISQDPLGMAAGDTNLYRYVGNSPTNLTDPTGRIWSWGLAAGGAAIGVGTYLIGSALTGNQITWGGAAGAAAAGFVAGSVVGLLAGDPTAGAAALTFSQFVGIGAAAGGSAGFVGSVVQQGIDNRGIGNISLTQVAISTVAGTLGGAVTGGVLGSAGTGFGGFLAAGLSGGLTGGAFQGGATAALNGQNIIQGGLTGAWQGAVYGAVGGGLGYGYVRANASWLSASVPTEETAPNTSNLHPTFRPGPFAGESIPAQSTAQTFTAAERAQINQIGSQTGCHTCGTTNPGTRSGNFVPDHQPPTALNTTGQPQQLYPQCINCSRQQGLAISNWLRGLLP